ncbi:hypothetical protein J6590_044465 [Homalodisca vitripennis]|nr:hypothetical protein J6590_044465 [Homalodisca vitripennis]
MDILRSFGLTWSVNSPTRVTAHSESAIDNLVTNIPDVSESVLSTGIADHYGQLAVVPRCPATRCPPVALKEYLIENTFYSVGEFRAGNQRCQS